jgi:putative DNA primase/helicase
MGVELLTGTVRPNRMEDYCTKSAACNPKRIPIPMWLAFLDQVTGGDKDLQAYLQRMAGYCLTGRVNEHVLFFLYGTGGNGKGVFIKTLAGIWDDYAVTAPMETFIETQSSRHPTELAYLQGARLVVAQETERGRKWAESKIKALTGGDNITARFMHRDFFTFRPQFKLVIVGNHKPSLTSVDEAIRRRFHLIPFTITIPPDKRDPDLEEKLKPEWPGILQWAVDGCLEWQRIGLTPPDSVRKATDEYLSDEDTLARWVDECCRTGKHLWEVGDRLWGSWKAWADRNNETPLSRKGFSQALLSAGYNPEKSQQVRGFRGLTLLQDDADQGDYQYRR